MIKDKQNYIRLFEEHDDYEAFSGSSEFIKPNVSHCSFLRHYHYTPKTCTPSQEYVFVDAETPESIPGSATSFAVIVNYQFIEIGDNCWKDTTSLQDEIVVEVGENPSTTDERTLSGSVQWRGETINYEVVQEPNNE